MLTPDRHLFEDIFLLTAQAFPSTTLMRVYLFGGWRTSVEYVIVLPISPRLGRRSAEPHT